MAVLTRWDPLRDIATLHNRINRFVRERRSLYEGSRIGVFSSLHLLGRRGCCPGLL
jgi:hypothetical protein